LYNVHHLRELQALIEIEKEEWAARIQRLLRRACHTVNLARDRQNLSSSSCLTRGLTRVPMKPSLIALIDRCYDRIIDDACAWHEALPLLTPKPSGKGWIPPAKAGGRIGHNLALCLRELKEEALRFLTNLTLWLDPGARSLINKLRRTPEDSTLVPG
jgi:transposase